MAKPLYAILLDGGYLTKRLYSKLQRHATPADIQAECQRLMSLTQVADYELLRIYYYDAFPSSQSIKLPISKGTLNLAATPRYRQSQSLFSQLQLLPHFALRMGELVLPPVEWRIKARVQKSLIVTPRALTDHDFELALSQKGVDMRVGMDMARLALRELVRTVIVVTADSDFVPAFKFVRREGVKVILERMGQSGSLELQQHADIVL